jgi:FxsC-like protein
MSFWFFLSYAREDDSDKLLTKFFNELSLEISLLAGTSDAVGFQDSANIPTGANWSQEIRRALISSRVLVCLFSPTYFNRDFCGKELQVFLDRLELYKQSHPPSAVLPRAILPVIWIPQPPEGLPKSVSELQHQGPGVPSRYAQDGLRFFKKLRRNDYKSFVSSFAQKVVDAARGPALPPLPYLPKLNNVRNAFTESLSTKSTEWTPGGPNSVKFVFVAARPSEIKKIRRELGPYDRRGASLWRPYLPECSDSVGWIAQQIALNERLLYSEISFNSRMIRELKAADQRNEIVVLVVDAWTIRIPRYEGILRAFDLSGLLNCAVLIPWNVADEETQDFGRSLQDQLKVTFRAKFSVRDPVVFQDSIYSVEELKVGMRNALTAIKMKIIEFGEAEKRIAGRHIPQPSIPVPGGNGSQ